MAIALANVVLRHERRVRLLFTADVAAGAFASTSFYKVENQDAVGVSPAVAAAIPVANSPNVVELALADDLVGGGLYRISAIGVPASDASTTDASSTSLARFGELLEDINSDVPIDDREALIYGLDTVWNGEDFAEEPNGDLSTIYGRANAEQAVSRGYMGNGLPWAPDWGAHPREYVDAPAGYLTPLKGALVRQGLRDDRVESVAVTISFDEENEGDAYFAVDTTLVGARSPSRTKVPIQTG